MCDWWNDSVHYALGSFINLLCGERDKGGTAPPLSIPAAQRGNRCCALRSPPACLTAAGSTRLTRPIHGTRPLGASASAVQNCSRQFCPCLGSPLSAIHGVQTLSFTLRFADFSGGQHRRCETADKSKVGVADILPDGAGAYPAYAVSAGSVLVGRIRRSRHPAIGAAERMPDGALHAYPAYAILAAISRHNHCCAIAFSFFARSFLARLSSSR